jgi:hypothetical protein
VLVVVAHSNQLIDCCFERVRVNAVGPIHGQECHQVSGGGNRSLHDFGVVVCWFFVCFDLLCLLSE